MAIRLPSGALFEPSSDGARYILPPHRPQRVRRGARRILAGALLAGLSGWIAWGIVLQLDRDHPSVGAVVFGFLLAVCIVVPALWLVWGGLRKIFGRSVLEAHRGRISAGEEWMGSRSVRESESDGELSGIDVARLGAGREEIVFTFRGGASFQVAAGWPGSFLRQFRDELRTRHLAPPRRAPVPRPPPSAPAPVPIAVPRPPGPGVRPAPPPVPKREGETGIEFLSDPTPAATPAAVGECQVCNTPMTADLVACQKCRTPHHRTCWEYLRRCSTYGCGGTRSMAAGPVTAEEPVVEIREGGIGKLKRRFLRDWMVQVASELGLGEVRSREKKHRHCEASFRVEGLACDLVGRKQGDRFDFVILAVLPTPEARAAAEALPAETTSVRRQIVSGGRLELRPPVPIDRLDALRRFVVEGARILGEVASRSRETVG